MFDFNRDAPSSFQCIFCFLIYFSFFLITYKYYFRLDRDKFIILKNVNVGIYIYALLITLTYFLDTDYFHYYHVLKKLSDGYENPAIEQVYPLIAKCVNYNYGLFRLIIWGSSLFIYSQLCKLNHIRIDYGIYFLMVMYGNIFSYARASLAMVILYYGFGIFLTKESHFDRIFGFSLMFISILFHTSIVIALICCFCSMIIKWKKSIIIIMLLSFPAVIMVLRLILNLALNVGGIEGAFINKLLYYTELQNFSDRTIFGKIQNFLEISSFVFPLIIICKNLYFDKINKNTWIKCLLELRCFQCAFLIILLSFAFNFIGLGTEVFSYRIRYMAMIPILISLLGLYRKHYLKKIHLQTCILIGFSSISMILFSALKSVL